MYPNTLALAQRIKKPIVTFDLEHTGGRGDTRFVTDFGAMLVTPEGEVTSFSSLVKPPAMAEFNPYVCKLTGIYPHTVARAPGWEHVLESFVRPNQGALWVGFNSRKCDTPMVRKECLRHGFELPEVDQLDLLRLGGESLKGSLSVRVAQLVPGFDVSGAHRGLKDALMTLVLLEAQLPTITDEELKQQAVLPGAKPRRASAQARVGVRKPPHVKRALDVSQFLVAAGVSRAGARWLEDETIWLASSFRRGKSVEQLAALNGRTPFAVACALVKAGLLEDAAPYKLEVTQ